MDLNGANDAGTLEIHSSGYIVLVSVELRRRYSFLLPRLEIKFPEEISLWRNARAGGIKFHASQAKLTLISKRIKPLHLSLDHLVSF